MTKLKQIRNDITYVMWALGLTGWISAIQRRIPKRHKAGTGEE